MQGRHRVQQQGAGPPVPLAEWMNVVVLGVQGAESLGQELADYGKKSFETASATMKSLATVKSPTEMFQIQSDFAKSSFDSAIAEASKLSEAWLKLAGEVIQPLSSRYAIAAEKIKSTAL